MIGIMVFFHISDEPGMDCLESYKEARESVKESLKGWQVVDALSEYSFYEKELFSIRLCQAII